MHASASRPHRLERLVLATMMALLAAAVARAEEPEPPQSTHCAVLMYHKFDEPEHPSTNISSAEFRRQMAYLRDEGYTVLSMDAFAEHLDTGRPFPAKSVLITIDDPYPSIDRVARPILESFGYPWTLFAWTSGIEESFPDLMDWADIERLAASGVTIGNHTHTHPYLGVPAERETREEYLARVAGEIQIAQSLLRVHGIENPYLAFPYGYYNNAVIDAARTAGYLYMFTQDPGSVDATTSPDRIPRAAMVGETDTMKELVYRLSLSPLHVTDVTPPVGALEENPPPRFGMRLLEPDRYDPGQLNMFISEWGRVDAEYSPESGVLSFVPSRRLGRKMNRMIVTARDRETGTFSMYSQMLIRPFEELTTASR